jgi:SAM-dependent methyltransferase
MTTDLAVRCPICGNATTLCWRRAWKQRTSVGHEEFRPNADTFGRTIGPVRACSVCRHRFVEPPAGYADGVAYEGVEGDEDPAARQGALLTYENRCRRMRSAGVGPRILEVGCWDAAHFGVYREHGFEPTGVEPSAWAVSRAVDAGHDVRLGTLDCPNVLSSLRPPFDAVLLFDVVEHVADPPALLEATIELVRPAGHVVLTTPRSSAFVARLLGSRWWSVMPMHVQFFSDQSARALLARQPRCGTAAFGFEPKAFPLSYYARRLQALLHVPSRLATDGGRFAGREVAPNFRDRLWVDVTVRR